MKRLQIMIEEDVDVALDRIARSEHVSKAALIRRFVRTALGEPAPNGDPLLLMSGADDFEPDHIDDVVYP
jgi:hypothetical protein